MEYEYSWLPGSLVTPDLLEELAALYSGHYGRWSAGAPRNPGQQIRLSSNRIGELLTPKQSRLAMANLGGKVVGYAIAIQAKVPGYGFVSWVTQLVVHRDHRRRDVGKKLLFSIWNFTDHFAWGLLTANPYAVRALEKATRRRCEPVRIARNRRKLKSIALQFVPYVKPDTTVIVKPEGSSIDTEFFLDHSTVEEKLKSVTASGVPWRLGPLNEGWEWFAFTFQNQEEIGLTPREIEDMLNTSDQVAKKAYSRMLLNKDHVWAQHDEVEAQFIASLCSLAASTSILDFGCGTGRHSVALASLGFKVSGVDYIGDFIERARQTAAKRKLADVRFEVGDCREIELGQVYDVVLCLYDVIGSYADDGENVRILQNVARHTKPGGTALLSVMNLELTERRAKHWFTIAREPNKLLSLKPSRTMEKTGNIFDPDYYMLDSETKIVYRKEQFGSGNSLPEEVIVRDRRYRKSEIEAMCRDAGLEVIWSRFVRAGQWDGLDAESDRAKEILVLCKKPEN